MQTINSRTLYLHILNKTPAQAFIPPAEKKMGTKWRFMYMQLLRQKKT